MKLVPEAVAEVVYFKAEAEYTTTEKADTVKEEYIMVVVDAEAEMEESVRIIQVTYVAYRTL